MRKFGLLLNGTLALYLVAAVAQQPTAQVARIHGQVTNYTGVPQNAGFICLSTDGGLTPTFLFPVNGKGSYSGEAPAGTYTMIYRMPDTPLSQWIDVIHNVVLTADTDLEQNDDMSRQEFIEELPAETRKQLEGLKRQNVSASDQEKLVKIINDDLRQAAQDLKDADNARNAAVKELGKAANQAEIDAKVASIRGAKCAQAESLMQKDLIALKESGLAADETALWEDLGRAQIGLKKYDDAERAYQKILEIQVASGNPKTAVQAVANAGLGEIYARMGKTADATKAFDLAAQLDPARAGLYLRNEALVFLQSGNAEAQITAAEQAIKADPKDPLPYYIKGNGLFKNAGIDPASKHYDLPDGCAEAYQKYLTLAPSGPYAPEAQSVLRRAERSTKAAN